jgi:hypothetical protein
LKRMRIINDCEDLAGSFCESPIVGDELAANRRFRAAAGGTE